jgi:site-specific recombinase XerD
MEIVGANDREAISRMIPTVLDSVTSLESKRSYERSIKRFTTWLESERPTTEFTKATVQAFRSHLIASGLASSTVNLYLTALRRLAGEATDNNLLLSEVAAGIGRVKGMRREGVRIGNWLTAKEAECFIDAPDVSTLKGRRDRALFAVLIGCGLRREEAADLTVEHVQQRDGRWVIVDMLGKGRRVRSIPMPTWAKAAIDVWTEAASIEAGRIFRPINKGDRLAGQQMTAQSVFVAVKRYADLLGFKIAPHDLRRSYARLAYDGGSTLEQIQLSLAHFSVQTTEKYVGVRQDLKNGPCDHLGLKL